MELEKQILQVPSYPNTTDENLQHDIYKKREFAIHAIPHRKKMNSYDEIKEYRDNSCARDFQLGDHQLVVANIINPRTPYRGLLLFQGTGTGKTGAAIACAEGFKSQVDKYGTKITVLVPGPLNKQNFLNEILKFTGDTYRPTAYPNADLTIEGKARREALATISRYYQILSYRTFHRRVLGEKIIERKYDDDNNTKIGYRKNDEGDYERDVAMDRIDSLNNTLLIADEAHYLTGAGRGDSMEYIIKNSINLKVLLLTATPGKNLASDIIPLINYIRPQYMPLEYDKTFTNERNNNMELKPGGEEYFRTMIRGYVSYLRGNDPITFPERIDEGFIAPGLKFTKVIRCFMKPFQLKAYQEVLDDANDKLDKKSEAVANFVYPGMNKGVLTGYHGINGMNIVKNQLKSNQVGINKGIADYLKISGSDASNMIRLVEGKRITGKIFNIKYLDNFSTKMAEAYSNISEYVDGNGNGKKGAQLVFVYSNLVVVGAMPFQEVLNENGYLEYNENGNYRINDDTVCYLCGYTHHNHSKSPIKRHEFAPATYMIVTGKTEDGQEHIPEEKYRIIRDVYNHPSNQKGKNLKIIIGTHVMAEGITLKMMGSILILDVHYTLGRVDQIIGRGIRFCTHYMLSNETNPFPKVRIRKYVASLQGEMSREEILYQKAEQKYMLIKRIELFMKEEAIDCPLNYSGNVFPEDVAKYANCNMDDPNNQCPAICGYMSCEFKCSDEKLNSKYYDPKRLIYRNVKKEDMDYSTYDSKLAKNEINRAKSSIKYLYRLGYAYSLDKIVEYVRNSYPEEKRDLFDDFYIYQALYDMLPVTSNDFNNFHDIIHDKYNNTGYLIYRENYYIFNRFDQPENESMYYRKKGANNINNNVDLKTYLSHTERAAIITCKYDFDSTMPYYNSRPEFEHVGIIDSVEKDRECGKDIFKLRVKRPENTSKKRETGVPAFTGAVCDTSKSKKELLEISKIVKAVSSGNRVSICENIRDRMFDLEKYQTGDDKVTYLIIPYNHPIYKFPLNLEDRMNIILNNIQDRTKLRTNVKKETIKMTGEYKDIEYKSYLVTFPAEYNNYADILTSNGAKLVDGSYQILLE